MILLINQSIKLLSTVYSETNKCKLRKKAQWRAASKAICLSMLATHTSDMQHAGAVLRWGQGAQPLQFVAGPRDF